MKSSEHSRILKAADQTEVHLSDPINRAIAKRILERDAKPMDRRMTTNVNKVIKRLNDMRSDMVSGNLHVMHNMNRADQNAALLDDVRASGEIEERVVHSMDQIAQN